MRIVVSLFFTVVLTFSTICSGREVQQEQQGPVVSIIHPTKSNPPSIQERSPYLFEFDISDGVNKDFIIYVDGKFVETLVNRVTTRVSLEPGSHLVEAFWMERGEGEEEEGERSDFGASVGVIVDSSGILRLGFETPRTSEEAEINILPLVCVSFLSCKRIDLFEKTLSAVQSYLYRVEPWISVQMAMVDNGSGESARERIMKKMNEEKNEILMKRRERDGKDGEFSNYKLDSVVFFRRNMGIAHAWNVLHMNLCTAQYLLTLEDDWIAKGGWEEKLPVISMAMEVLDHDERVLEVWLHDFKWFPEYEKNNRSQWLVTPSPRRVMYRTQFVDGEVDYARRVNAAGFCSAHLCLHLDQTVCTENRDMYEIARGVEYKSLFSHGDGEYRSSSGHKDYVRDVRKQVEL